MLIKTKNYILIDLNWYSHVLNLITFFIWAQKSCKIKELIIVLYIIIKLGITQFIFLYK